MQQQIVLLGLLASLGSAYCGITEWPLTLHHGIQGNGLEDNYVDGVPIVDPPYHSAGYMPLNNTEDAKLFYFYFQERSKDPDAPLLFWTNGGPGCSSMFGLFMENGPYVIQEDLTLKWREHGWDVGQNMIFVDQPVGTGFSEGDEKYYAHYEDTVGEDVLMFFLEFMDLHPELRGKDLYLSGESYAGHYLPGIANAIYEANRQERFQHLNLKGVMMGNPWTSPAAMYPSFPAFAYLHNLITKETADSMLSKYPKCKEWIDLCHETKKYEDCASGKFYCFSKLSYPVKRDNPDLNRYDIRKKCIYSSLCYDTSLIETFLNSPEVQAQLGVHKKWKVCAWKVGDEMRGDGLLDMGPTVQKLVDNGIRFLVYVGDQDLICDWIGNKAWLDSMPWEKSDQWTGSLKPWKVKTKAKGLQAAGECESVEPLTFCKVFESGHMVPMDQPENALAMVHTFIGGDSFVDSDPTLGLQRSEGGVTEEIVAVV